jgi:mRNA deadenylase 3'-5' endonuclease subunit Ccr4
MVCTRKFVNRGSRAVDENPLTVVSWNILADQYTDDQFASNCSPEHLAWENRLPRIIDELISYDADVICLQEVGGLSNYTNLEFRA